MWRSLSARFAPGRDAVCFRPWASTQISVHAVGIPAARTTRSVAMPSRSRVIRTSSASAIVSDRRDQPWPGTEPSGGDGLIEALAARRKQEHIACDAVGW
jgi:hypothetical protein